MEDNYTKGLAKLIGQLIKVIIFMLLVILALTVLLYKYLPAYVPSPHEPEIELKQAITEAPKVEEKTKYWQAPDITAVVDVDKKEQIAYGKDLIANTALYFGPEGKVFKSSTNGMNCQNCHLDAGTKIFGNNYSAVASTYPKFRARSGARENIYKRVNDCFERSLNGKGLDTNSKEMQAITAYINFLGIDVNKGEKPEGSGLKKLAFLDRAASPVNGDLVYKAKCQSCHQANGEGLLNVDKTVYTYPPLWGKNSYNDGAGLYRISNFASYVKYNMPLGASHDNLLVTDEEAWDLAAFVNSQPRPKKDTKNDWPNIEEKPFDHPFGPFADGFDEKQHKYGPFKAIQEKLEEIKKSKSK
ncbi:MAG: c-type cytochrome [Bacteroidota bacterium]